MAHLCPQRIKFVSSIITKIKSICIQNTAMIVLRYLQVSFDIEWPWKLVSRSDNEV